MAATHRTSIRELDHRRNDGATAAAVVATLGLAAACWVVAVRLMNGMDMGVATALGSVGSFIHRKGEA
jgi:hypothetical protein